MTSPLPLQTAQANLPQNAALAPVGERISAAFGVAPVLDAQTAVSAGMAANSTSEAVTNAAATAAYGESTNLLDAMKQFSPHLQQTIWNGITPTAKSRLVSVGYSPPQAQQPAGQNWFGGFVSAIGKGVAGAFSGVATGFKNLAGTGLKLLNVPLNTEQHMWRAGQMVMEGGYQNAGQSPQQIQQSMLGQNRLAAGQVAAGAMLPGLGVVNDLKNPGEFEHMFSPHAWAQAWKETTNGQQTFDPAITIQIQKQVNPQTFSIAKLLASGVPEAQITGSVPAAQRDQIVQLIHSSQMKSTVQQLNAAHLSVGRSIVEQQLLVQHPALGRALSGGIDGAFDALADPTMHLGAVAKAVRTARAGIDVADAGAHLDELAKMTPSEIQALDLTPSARAAVHLRQTQAALATQGFAPVTGEAAGAIGSGDATWAQKYAYSDTTAYASALRSNAGLQRWVHTIGDAIAQHGITATESYDPRVMNMAAAMGEFGVHDAESLGHFMLSQAGVQAVLDGKAAMQHAGPALLPTLTPLGWARMQAKGLLAKAIDWSADSPDLSHFKNVPLAPEDLSVGSTMGNAALDSTASIPKNAEELLHPDGMPLERKARATLSQIGVRGLNLSARALRRMTTLTPTSGVMDLTSADAPVTLKRMLEYSLPASEVNRVVDGFIATENIGDKFRIWKGGVNQMLVHAGLDPASPEYQALNDVMDRSFRSATYGTDGIAKMADGHESGIGLAQMNTHVHVPSFRDVRLAVKRQGIYSALGMKNLPDTVDKMMGLWKASVLMRPGFAFRVALSDEAFGNILRNGFTPYLLARHAAKQVAMDAVDRAYWLKAGEDGTQAELDKLYHGRIEGVIGRALNAMTSNIPPQLLAKVRSVNDMASLLWGHTTWSLYKAAGHGELKTLPEYLDAARAWRNVWEPQSTLFDGISSTAHGYLPADGLAAEASKGNKLANLQTSRSGLYSEALKGSDPMYLNKWAFQLNLLSSDPIARNVLKGIEEGETKAAQARRVEADLLSPTYASTVQKAERWNTLADGRQVGINATREQAVHEWAAKYVQWVHDAMVEGGNVTQDAAQGPLHDLMASMKSGTTPSTEELSTIPHDLQPRTVFGPQYLPTTTTQNLVNKGMHILSRQIDWISREPMTLQAFTEELPQARKFARSLLGADATPEAVDSLAAEKASLRTFERIKPYIHSPEIRSQFEVMHRTAMPFLFAQDQFIKRWARTFVDNPAAIRKAQLLMNGLNQSGFVYTDQNGNRVFNYPLSNVGAHVVAWALQRVGVGANLPVSVPFTGQVSGLMPGLNNPVTPSVGPVVAIPLKALANIFPELQPLQQQLLQAGASTGYLSQVVPSTVSRLATAMGNGNQSGEFASAMVYSMQQLAANGDGLPENATAAQTQAYLDRVRNWTRSVMLTRVLLGFFSPASPTADFDPSNISERLRQLLSVRIPANPDTQSGQSGHPGRRPSGGGVMGGCVVVV